MELIEEGSLAAELKKHNKFPWEEVIPIGLQIFQRMVQGLSGRSQAHMNYDTAIGRILMAIGRRGAHHHVRHERIPAVQGKDHRGIDMRNKCGRPDLRRRRPIQFQFLLNLSNVLRAR